MDEQGTRLAQLEQEMRRLRRTARVQTAALTVLLAALAVGATTQPQEVTLRKLTIVDADGKTRISAETRPDGTAQLSFRDRGGKSRIVAATDPDGSAHLAIADRNGKVRWGETSP